jgi:hypothetical protein
MAHLEPIDIQTENRHMGDLAGTLSGVSFLVGGVGILVSLVLAFFSGPYGTAESSGLVRWQFAYLLGFMFFMTLVLGGLFFTLGLYVTGAKWGIVIRRVPELVAASAPVMAILFLPILIPLLLGNHSLYVWSDPQVEAEDHLMQGKSLWLNTTFFTIRLIIYFTIWSALGVVYLNRSVKSDETGDPIFHAKCKWLAPLGLILFALSTTFASFDLLMSLTPSWYSTIFGVYIFAGASVAIFSFTTLAYCYLQRHGILARAVTVEHYHDIGKLLFSFVVFWGYIAFSQYMLIWYANVPEETAFYKPRQYGPWWMTISFLLLFVHLLIPLGGLMSRWMKRDTKRLIFWSLWMLAAHWLDMYYLIVPTWAGRASGNLLAPINPPLPLMEIACTLGIGGLWLGALARRAASISMVPEKDPYLKPSLVFENF